MKALHYFIILFASFFYSCNEDIDKSIILKDIQLNTDSISLHTNESYQFSVITTPSNYPIDNLNWTVTSVDGEGAGIINKEGVFTALKPGVVKVELIALDLIENNFNYNCSAKVLIKDQDQDIPEEPDDPEEPKDTVVSIKGITFSGNTQITKGVKEYIYYEIEPSNADFNNIKWNVSDESIISILSIEKNRICVLGNKKGYATIYALVNDVKYGYKVEVENVKIKEIVLSPTQKVLTEGDEFNLTVEIYPQNAEEELMYNISNEEIICFSDDKKTTVKALSKGVGYITVSTIDGRISEECKVIVEEKLFQNYFNISTILNGTYNKGFISGDVKIKILNSYSKNVTIKRFYIYDYNIQDIIYEDNIPTPFKAAETKEYDISYSMAYEPSYNWEIESDGTTYYVKYQEDYSNIFPFN